MWVREASEAVRDAGVFLVFAEGGCVCPGGGAEAGVLASDVRFAVVLQLGEWGAHEEGDDLGNAE